MVYVVVKLLVVFTSCEILPWKSGLHKDRRRSQLQTVKFVATWRGRNLITPPFCIVNFEAWCTHQSQRQDEGHMMVYTLLVKAQDSSIMLHLDSKINMKGNGSVYRRPAGCLILYIRRTAQDAIQIPIALEAV